MPRRADAAPARRHLLFARPVDQAADAAHDCVALVSALDDVVLYVDHDEGGKGAVLERHHAGDAGGLLLSTTSRS